MINMKKIILAAFITLVSNLSDEDYKNAILGTGFEVIKVVSVDKIVTDPGEAVKILD